MKKALLFLPLSLLLFSSFKPGENPKDKKHPVYKKHHASKSRKKINDMDMDFKAQLEKAMVDPADLSKIDQWKQNYIKVIESATSKDESYAIRQINLNSRKLRYLSRRGNAISFYPVLINAGDDITKVEMLIEVYSSKEPRAATSTPLDDNYYYLNKYFVGMDQGGTDNSERVDDYTRGLPVFCPPPRGCVMTTITPKAKRNTHKIYPKGQKK